MPCLQVAVAALEVLVTLCPVLRERITPGLNTLVPALATALGSTNDKVCSAGVVGHDVP